MKQDFYYHKKISDLDLQADRKVCVFGKIENVAEDKNFVINDGTGRLEVVNDKLNETIKQDSMVRIFATNFEGKIKADIVQDFSGSDIELFKKTMEIYERSGL